MKYEIKKTSACKQPNYDPADFDDHIAGSVGVGDYSLPIDYTITGKLVYPLRHGECFMVDRDSRNGVPIKGMMASTEIESIQRFGSPTFHNRSHKIIVTTQNSVYLFTPIKDNADSI